MRWKLHTFILWIGIGKGFFAEASTRCLGQSDGKYQAVYLHGFLQPNADDNNAELMIVDKVAKELDIKIAAPRARSLCGINPMLCWEQSRPEAVKATWQQIKTQIEPCFKWQPSAGLIGFSNGGYFGGKLLLACPADAPAWIVAVGSAGGPQSKVPASLAQCPKISFSIGTKDQAFATAKEYFEKLSQRGARTRFSEFKGGHELKESELRTLLTDFLK